MKTTLSEGQIRTLQSRPAFIRFRLNTVLLSIVLWSTSAFAQIQPVWTNCYDNSLPAKTSVPLGVAVDPDGNIVVAGSSANTNNVSDYVVLKYNPSGSPLWVCRFDSGANDETRGFSLDASGNALVTGTTRTVRVDTNGAVQWNAPYAGRAIASDTNANVYVTGFSELDFATAKLDTAGSNLWTRTYDRAGLIGDISQKIALLPDGKVVVAGIEHWADDIVGGYFQPSVICYNQAGQLLWTNSFYLGGFPATSELRGLVSDAQGHI